MSLLSRIGDLITAIGADVKSLNTAVAAVDQPWTYIRQASNQANSTTTLADLTGMTLGTSLAAGTYEIEAKFMYSSAAATTALYMSLVYPAQVDPAISWEIAEGGFNYSVYHVVSSAVLAGGAASPAANKNVFARLDGFFTVSGAMASAMKIQFRSEVAGSAVTVKPPSFIRYRRLS